MIPRMILDRLAGLRRREKSLRLAWGAARWGALVVAAVLFGCLVDWAWDRSDDTPRVVRVGLLALSIGAAAYGLIAWVLAPLFRRLSDDVLALWVEEKTPTLQHRLISAVQLNRPGADKRGMSEELIAVMTREAEAQARAVAFADVADGSRLRKAALTLGPALVAALVPFLFAPKTASALVARHFLGDVEIPRRVSIAPVAASQVRPAGERTSLAFRVQADALDEAMTGTVWVTPEGMPRDRYPLTFSHREGEAAVFVADVAPSSLNLTYGATLGDGRTRAPGVVRMVPRPVVSDLLAWTVLPEFCGTRPSGGRYEMAQPRADVIGIAGSAARVSAQLSRPVVKGVVELYGRDVPEGKEPSDTDPETLRRTIPLTLGDGNSVAEATFDLKADEVAYRVRVEDENGFANVPTPRRTLRVVAEEAPTVTLLKDYFTPVRVGKNDSLDDYFVEGMPIPIGETIRVPYLAEGPYGLGQSWFLYRVLRKMESGVETPEDEPWIRLPLSEVSATAKTGGFDLRRGVFENTPPDKSVDFHAVPSFDPERFLGRTTGGGRFHFKTSGIPDGKGGTLKLGEGDKIEYCVEIHADRGKTPGRPIARSETRVQTLGSFDSLLRWIRDIGQEERRLREIDTKQRTLFGPP